jgi:NADPH:quinone reductase-like Zn-dependent oxidoreductase
MKVVEIRDSFGLEHLAVGERPAPRPGTGQILLSMRAASLNSRDLLTVLGRYNPRQPLPLIPCSDGVGQVTAVGKGVTRFVVGDRVAPIFAQGWISGEPTRDKLRSTLGGPLDGTLTEQMIVDVEGAVLVPEHLSDEQAATLPCAALTAWSCLVTHGELKAGDTVLVQGTGGVSVFALQLAQALGARVVVTSSSDEKLKRARRLGAWQTINYRETPEWSRRVIELTDGRGVDVVVEVGGAGTLAQSIRAVRFGGRICLIGVLGGAAAELNIVPVFMRQVRVQGILVGHRDGFEDMNRALETSRLIPVVDRVFKLEQAREALEYLASGEHFGKICLRFD